MVDSSCKLAYGRLTAGIYCSMHRAGFTLLLIIMLAGTLATARAQTAMSADILAPKDAALSALALADERLALMPAVAAYKWRAKQPISDPSREAVVVSHATEKAVAAGLEGTAVSALFESQIKLARDSQLALTARWHRDGFDDTLPPRSLAEDLRPTLDDLTARWIAALYLAAPTLADPRTIERLIQLAPTALPDARWTDDSRAALIHSLAEVRLAAPRSLERARAAGILRIGTPADYAPFSRADAHHVVGSDVALAIGLAKALNLKPVFMRTTWKSLLSDLMQDQFDMAVGGVSVNAQRALMGTFSIPLSQSGKTAIGRCADRSRFSSLTAIDSPGTRVIENPGGTNEAFAHRTLVRASITVHRDNLSIFDELVSSRADVMFTDETEIALATHQHPTLCRLLNEAYEPSEKAWLLPRETEWKMAVDAWLAPEIASGRAAQLLQQALAHD